MGRWERGSEGEGRGGKFGGVKGGIKGEGGDSKIKTDREKGECNGTAGGRLSWKKGGEPSYAAAAPLPGVHTERGGGRNMGRGIWEGVIGKDFRGKREGRRGLSNIEGGMGMVHTEREGGNVGRWGVGEGGGRSGEGIFGGVQRDIKGVRGDNTTMKMTGKGACNGAAGRRISWGKGGSFLMLLLLVLFFSVLSLLLLLLLILLLLLLLLFLLPLLLF